MLGQVMQILSTPWKSVILGKKKIKYLSCMYFQWKKNSTKGCISQDCSFSPIPLLLSLLNNFLQKISNYSMFFSELRMSSLWWLNCKNLFFGLGSIPVYWGTSEFSTCCYTHRVLLQPASAAVLPVGIEQEVKMERVWDPSSCLE